MEESKIIQEFKEFITKIPSITKKQSEKITNYLLNTPKEFSEELINNIRKLKDKVSFCEKCNFIKEKEKCLNCAREDVWNILMIVDNIQNAKKIISLDFFKGYFYVMPYLLDLNNKGNDYNFPQLLEFIREYNPVETVVVLSPTIEGELTTTHLLKLFKNNNINASRAAIGMPLGSNIEYLDEFTLKQSIENRKNN
ncbi:recombinational DNA repair protein [Mycoplasmopsis maculosa]|uniref:Recombinational DNA repair protein n=1 Tax=Mycoplasmopsis maculosa TaxID=114885 RepID=A0A449B4R5_9BACT|nr:toprim domain-containing protein [Mycoplasmopsis maculosa]VEU75580.1 recombinational DNA repair protein [Mycoplasmopsis maculosa]